MSEQYALKALIERVLGHEAYLRVKEFAPLSAWKTQTSRLLKALRRSIELTVVVADQDWRDEVEEVFTLGLERIKRAPSVSELHAGIAATFGEIAFLQVGFLPDYSVRRTAPPITSTDWNLALTRSVQYVQSEQQKLDAKRIKTRLQMSEK
jgi:hypothetical protein